MRILVTGGAGYIGSVMTEVLVGGGHDVTVFDNLSRGHRDAISERAAFVEGDLVDTALVFRTLTDNGIEAVIHMAGDALVAESMEKPARYYRNNLIAGLSLLDAMRDAGVMPIVFSSTCAVYGVPERTPLDEAHGDEPDQSLRRVEAGLRARARMVPPRARLQGRRAAIFQCCRRRRTFGRTPRARNASDSARARSGGGREGERDDFWRTTIRPATARAYATTFTCSTSPTRICSRSIFCGATSLDWKSTTSAAAGRGTRIARSSRVWRPSLGNASRPSKGRGAPGTLPCSWRLQTKPAASWAGSPLASGWT